MVFPGACKRKMGSVALGGSVEQETRQRAKPTAPGVNGKRWATRPRESSPLCVLLGSMIRALLVPCTFEALSKD